MHWPKYWRMPNVNVLLKNSIKKVLSVNSIILQEPRTYSYPHVLYFIPGTQEMKAKGRHAEQWEIFRTKANVEVKGKLRSKPVKTGRQNSGRSGRSKNTKARGQHISQNKYTGGTKEMITPGGKNVYSLYEVATEQTQEKKAFKIKEKTTN